MNQKYICIHGHFYQPPRENPWLETIEVQDSAYPYHDWNERITRECYAPNTASRLLDESGRIKGIVNNLENISFNIGPTLASWLEKHDPRTYKRIIEADKASVLKHNGHGSAIAQAYNHMIMPLASSRDKRTQVLWGIADFEHRFNRKPEGMWLPETAVDKETLQIMRENGITYTILYQGQARAMRHVGNDEWGDINEGVDPTRAYSQPLPDGESIAIFFYDGPISQAVAFENLLDDGHRFVDRLKSGFSDERNWSQLMNLGTDGETYGHHHRFGEMALAFAIDWFDCCDEIVLTNYGEYLALHPPEMEVDIHDNTSWSCAHGVERWKSDCGCSNGAHGWNQQWRDPLRESLDFLKGELDRVFESEGSKLFKDSWKARDKYIDVILDRARTHDFLKENQKKELAEENRVRAMTLLEMQRNAMLMYTSCGWFFDDVSGIETIQILRYAARAIQLCDSVSKISPEEKFLDILKKAESNITAKGRADEIYHREVLPEKAELPRILANHIISRSVSQNNASGIGESFTIEEREVETDKYGDTSLTLSNATIKSNITLEEISMVVATLALGATDVTCFVKSDGGKVDYEPLRKSLFTAWNKRELTDVVRKLDDMFESRSFTLKDMFTELRRDAVTVLFDSHIRGFSDTYDQLFWRNRKMMDYFVETNVPVPLEFRLAAQYIVEKELIGIASSIDQSDSAEKLGDMMMEAGKWGVKINLAPVRKELETRLWDILDTMIVNKDLDAASIVLKAILAAHTTEIDLDLWGIQNRFAGVYKKWLENSDDPFYGHNNIKKLVILLNFSLENGD